MLAFLVQGISSFPLSSHIYRPHHHRLQALLTPPLCVTLSTQSQLKSQEKEKEDIPFVAQYLISSFGLSPDRALKVSAYSNLAAIKSSAQPESVICFLKDIGLSDSQIQAAVSLEPMLLSYDVEKTLKPVACELAAAGFTQEILVQLIQLNPAVFSLKNPVLQLQFWREFVGHSDEALIKVIRKNPMILKYNIKKDVVPRLNLFREYGFSSDQITAMLIRGSRYFFRNLDYLKRDLEQTKKLGFEPGSGMFLEGLMVVGSYKEDTFNQKIEIFKKLYGWSEEDVYSAFRKYPRTVAYSEERVKSHMDFLINTAMLDPRSIASQPLLIGCSLERTLVPRHHILSILKEHGLQEYNLLNACVASEKRFLQKYVMAHEKDVPGLAEAYAAACAGKVSN